MTIGSVRTTVTVDLTPDDAFEVFTAEMPAWYRRGAASLGRRQGDDTDPEGYQWGFMTGLDTGYVQIRSLEDGGLEEIRVGGA